MSVGWAKAPTGPAFGRPDDRLRAAPTFVCSWWARRFAPLPTLRCVKTLIIDHHAPRNTPDWNRNRGLASLEVDHGDVVAEAVGDIKRLFVARHAETPGALADQDVALNFAGRYIDDGDVGRVAKCHISGLAVPGDAKVDRRHVGFAHAWGQELDLAFDGKFLTIDDVNLAGQLGRHP